MTEAKITCNTVQNKTYHLSIHNLGSCAREQQWQQRVETKLDCYSRWRRHIVGIWFWWGRRRVPSFIRPIFPVPFGRLRHQWRTAFGLPLNEIEFSSIRGFIHRNLRGASGIGGTDELFWRIWRVNRIIVDVDIYCAQQMRIGRNGRKRKIYQ